MFVVVAVGAPGAAFGVFASIDAVFDFSFEVEAQEVGFDPGADVEADAIVEVGVPADGLFAEGFPAYKDVVGRFAGVDEEQFFPQFLGGGQAQVGTGLAGLGIVFLAVQPVGKIGVDQAFEQAIVKLVVVDEGMESVFAAIPDMPDKGAILEEFDVSGKGLVA